MSRSAQKKVTLEQLVDELLKEKPDHPRIKQLSGDLNIPYSADPVTQMNTVLQSMNSVYLRTNRRTDLES
jgi:hypothetical protein